MNNEEKAKALLSRLYLLISRLVLVINDNADKGLCLTEEWDKYIETVFPIFLKILYDDLIPGSINPFEFKKIETKSASQTKKERTAPPFEEKYMRVNLKAKPISDYLKYDVLLKRIIEPAYLQYLQEKNNKN